MKKFLTRITCLTALLVLLCASGVFANAMSLTLSGEMDEGEISLSWTSAKYEFGSDYTADSYTVQRKLPGEADFSTIDTVKGNSYSSYIYYTDKSAPFCDVAEYRVLASVKDRYDSSVPPMDVASNLVTLNPMDGKVPNLYTVDGGPTSLEPKWDEMSGAAGYDVYTYNPNNRTYKFLATVEGSATTSYLHSPLKDTTIYYAIKAFGYTNGIRYETDYSDPFPGGTNGVKYTLKVQNNGYGNVKISWVDPIASPDYDGDYYFEPTGFVVYKKTSANGQWKVFRNVPVDAYEENYSITDKNVAFGTTAYYKLGIKGKTIFWGSDYEFDWATESAVKSIKAAKAKAPKIKVSATATNSSLKLTWSKVNGAAGYKIYAANSKNGKYKLVKTIKKAGTTSWTHTGLKLGATKHYKVKAYKGKFLSDYSNRVSKKVTKNQKTWYPSKSFDDYGGPNLRDKSVSYSNGKLQYKALVLNDRIFYASNFDWIRITIYADGKLIGSQKFYDKYIGLDAYDYKYMTFTLNNGTKKKVNLRNASISVDWEYHYTYLY